jgi:hypothetical protein
MNVGRRTLGLVSGGGQAAPGLSWEANAVSFVSPNTLQVAGRNATNDYIYGTVVYVPGGGWASSLGVVYTGGNSIVLLSNSVCFSGMSAVGRAPLSYNPATICSGGTPISSGQGGGSLAAVFDGVLAAQGTYCLWFSTQNDTAISGNSYVGYQFSSGVSPAWFRLVQPNGQYGVGTSSMWGPAYISSVLWQYSDNGSSWTTQATVNNLRSEVPHFAYCGAPAASHVYWRLLANANPLPAGGTYTPWGVVELQMGV